MQMFNYYVISLKLIECYLSVISQFKKKNAENPDEGNYSPEGSTASGRPRSSWQPGLSEVSPLKHWEEFRHRNFIEPYFTKETIEDSGGVKGAAFL